MKSLMVTILLFLSVNVNAQQSDVMYVPNQNALVCSYNFRQIGLYTGGSYMTTIPHAFIYTTPRVVVNRLGLTYVNKKNTYSIMGGGFLKNNITTTEIVPDLWLKIFPIRMMTKEKSFMDFAIGLNYSEGFRYGIGLSIPFSSIYNR
jgi:hypothetical protein